MRWLKASVLFNVLLQGSHGWFLPYKSHQSFSPPLLPELMRIQQQQQQSGVRSRLRPIWSATKGSHRRSHEAQLHSEVPNAHLHTVTLLSTQLHGSQSQPPSAHHRWGIKLPLDLINRSYISTIILPQVCNNKKAGYHLVNLISPNSSQ